MANLQPHVLVLNIIKQTFEVLKNNEDVLDFILSGYKMDLRLSNVYGRTFIDNAIDYIKSGNMNYVLGYRLDIAKLPNVSVTFEGGAESDQFIGDFGRFFSAPLPPKTYATFHASDIQDGALVVPKEYELQGKIWPKLQLRNAKGNTWILNSIIQPPPPNDSSYYLYLDKTVTYEDGLENWTAISPNRAQIVTVGSSLDNVTIKVYLDVPGDPEVCDVLSSVMRHTLKQSRLALAEYGINVATFRFSPIGRNESYSGQNVWTAEFTIIGKMTDEWIQMNGCQMGVETVDSMTVECSGACCGEDD